jgi:hypothetical protein
MSAEQKTPLWRSLPAIAAGVSGNADAQQGISWPCKITEVDKTGTIVTVEFLITADIPIPQVECPVCFPEYVRWPLKKGDLGFCVPADAVLAGVTGQASEGFVASLILPFNMSALVFVPLGNARFADTPDPEAVVMYGPNGVILSDEPPDDPDVVAKLQPEGVVIARGKGEGGEYDQTFAMNDNGVEITHKDRSVVLNDGGAQIKTPGGTTYIEAASIILNGGGNSVSIDAAGVRFRGPGGAAIDMNAGGISLNFDGMFISIGNGAIHLFAADGTTHVSISNNLAQVGASGASVVVQQNAVSESSAGTISIDAPNGQSIHMDPGRVAIQSMDFKQHFHTGVVPGGGNSGLPTGP